MLAFFFFLSLTLWKHFKTSPGCQKRLGKKAQKINFGKIDKQLYLGIYKEMKVLPELSLKVTDSTLPWHVKNVYLHIVLNYKHIFRC